VIFCADFLLKENADQLAAEQNVDQAIWLATSEEAPLLIVPQGVKFLGPSRR